VAEDADERARRERRRAGFDRVAERYHATRVGYPDALVDEMLATAGVGPGDPVLEVGCGTGQLTRQLVDRGVAVTAVDLGPAMVAVARERLPAADVRWWVGPFEEFGAGGEAFALVASATAFHWIDPAVGLPRAAELLRPGGWLAVLSTFEHYDEPVGTAVREAWMRQTGATTWHEPDWPPMAAVIEASPRFGDPVVRTHAERRTLGPGEVVDLERTRATYLDFDGPTQAAFTADATALVTGLDTVGAEQRSALTMAPVVGA
jgi:ubiquinone/menaquinone biosynthesis C-methylase UbiE